MKTLPALTEGTPKLKTRSSQPRTRKTKTSAIPTNDTKIRTLYKTRDTVKLRPFRWLSFRDPKTRDLHATSTFRSMPELRSALHIQHSWLARDQSNTRHLIAPSPRHPASCRWRRIPCALQQPHWGRNPTGHIWLP